MRDKFPRHGPRRRWYRPWKVVCRCGLDAYPCVVVRMLGRPRPDDARAVGELYNAGVRSAIGWSDMERRTWFGGRRDH